MSKDAELLVLRHENAVLRRQVGRVSYEPGDRLWLAALSRLVSCRRWDEVFMVTRRHCWPGTGGRPARYYLSFAGARTGLPGLSGTILQCPHNGDGQHWNLAGAGQGHAGRHEACHILAGASLALEHVSFYPASST